jgi:hypothetical protein
MGSNSAGHPGASNRVDPSLRRCCDQLPFYTWQDDLPKVITVADDYFTVPLRIELKRRSRAAQTGPIRVEVGACQTEGMCIPVAIDVASVAPRGSSRRIDCGH